MPLPVPPCHRHRHAMLRLPVCLSVCLASAAPGAAAAAAATTAADPTCAYIQRRGSRNLGPPKKLDLELSNDRDGRTISAALPHSDV